MLVIYTCLLSTPVVPNFFTADLWYEGKKGRFAVSLDYPESAMAQVSGDGSIQVSQQEFASMFTFGKIDHRDTEVLNFLNENDLVGIVGRDNLQKCIASYSLVSGEVSFRRESAKYRYSLPGNFTEQGFLLKPAEGVSYLLTSSTSSRKPVAGSDTHFLSSTPGQKVYIAEINGGIAFFESVPEGEATRIGLAAWGAKEIQISATGISFNREGALLLAQLCDLIPAWCEEVTGKGVRVYPCMGVLPVGLKPGDLVTSIQGVELTSRDWREKSASAFLEAMIIQEWELTILERNGKVKALSVNRLKLYKP